MVKIDLNDKTLTQFLKLHGFGWDILEENKVVSNRTYYRMIKGEHTPRKSTIKKITTFLKIDEKTFLKLLENEIEARKNK
jgi:transcriptional regulator with XRE-family HTH domain